MIKLQEIIGKPTLNYHLDNNLQLNENIFRYSSDKFIELFSEARAAFKENKIELKGLDLQLITETDIGEYGRFGNKVVPLDLPLLNEEKLNEAEYQGKDVDLNKPKRGGSKAYYVYVKDPKTKNVKKVSFGSGGLKAKLNDKDARTAFAKRHKCSTKKDKTKPGYWSCRLPRYAKQLGMSTNYTGFW